MQLVQISDRTERCRVLVAPEDGDGLLLRRAAEFARTRILTALRLMGNEAVEPAAPGTEDCDQLLTDARMRLPRPNPGMVSCPGTEHRTVANLSRPPAHLARREAGARAREDAGRWMVPS